MNFITGIMSNGLTWNMILDSIVDVALAIFCLTIHEYAHGYVAYRLGDNTAKEAGRLTLNPLKSFDPVGMFLMATVHVGWAKPVPINPQNFKNPKWGFALVALAGPAINFLTAGFCIGCSGLIQRMETAMFALLSANMISILAKTAQIILDAAVFNVALGIFNLVPIPPMDGSRVFLAFLPDRAYYTILRYERYIRFVIIPVVWFGFLDAPLKFGITHVVNALGVCVGYPGPLF